MTQPIRADERQGRVRSAPLLILAVALVACGAQGSSVAPSASDGPVVGAWVLVDGSIDGVDAPVLDDHRITLTIDGSRISGVAACNQYGGEITAAGDGLHLEDLGQTAMGCEEPAMSAETAFMGALGRVRQIRRDGAELIAAGDGIELRFEALEPPPTAELVDTAWTLETVFVGDVAAAPLGDPASLELRGDGTLTGSTGCRTFSGQWVEEGDQIQAPSLAMDDGDCPADLRAQDDHVVSVIGDGFVASIEGDLLTLTDPGGVGLVYRSGR